MTQLALSQGSYQARGVIANAQACINLYPEPNPKDAPFPVTHYPGPGLAVAADFTGTYSGPVRGLYETSNGALIAAIGADVISWNPLPPNWTNNYHLGNIGNNGNPVSICDNQDDLVVVDGSANGWHMHLSQLGTPGSLTAITDPGWYGSNRVDYIDSFLTFNKPGTSTFYTSTAGTLLPIDPTYATPKAGWNDDLIACCALHDNVWLLGAVTTEVWFNAGGATFPFARMPNSILQQGCVAAFSPVIADNAVYWLSQDRWGRNMCMRGEGYAAKRVSTFAVEDVWSKYPTISDAVGMAYQIGGHESIAFWFPSGNGWWTYDAATQMWHQRTYNDTTTAWLPRCFAGWGALPGRGDPNTILAGDRTGPRILLLGRQFYDDCGTPIIRQRSWPHVQNDGKRLAHTRFAASLDGSALASPARVTLDWSDDAGHTFGTPVPQAFRDGTYGQYQWQRLGYARDRVYRLTWSETGEAALNGAWIDVLQQGS